MKSFIWFLLLICITINISSAIKTQKEILNFLTKYGEDLAVSTEAFVHEHRQLGHEVQLSVLEKKVHDIEMLLVDLKKYSKTGNVENEVSLYEIHQLELKLLEVENVITEEMLRIRLLFGQLSTTTTGSVIVTQLPTTTTNHFTLTTPKLIPDFMIRMALHLIKQAEQALKTNVYSQVEKNQIENEIKTLQSLIIRIEKGIENLDKYHSLLEEHILKLKTLMDLYPVATKRPTQKPTPAPTQPPTQKPTPVLTQPPTQKPTPAPIQPPTQKPTPAPIQPPTQKPTPVLTHPPTQKPTIAPTQPPTTIANSNDPVIHSALEAVAKAKMLLKTYNGIDRVGIETDVKIIEDLLHLVGNKIGSKLYFELEHYVLQLKVVLLRNGIH